MSEVFETNDGINHTKELSISEIKEYTYYVSCQDSSGAITFSPTGSNKINFTIDSNTLDQVPPNLYNAGPTSDQIDGTTQINIYANTNEKTNCRYSDNLNHDYEEMNEMSTTGSNIHGQLITGLSDGNSYSFYFICEDTSGNRSDKRGISFSISQFILQDGASLYTTYCSYCHGNLPFSEKQGATASRIRNGINGVGSMRALELLRESEINNIVDALK